MTKTWRNFLKKYDVLKVNETPRIGRNFQKHFAQLNWLKFSGVFDSENFNQFNS